MALRYGGVQYATITVKRCPMADPACAAKVAEHIATFYCQPFTAEQALALIEERCGRFVRGPKKGLLRGWAAIEVVTEGGWRRHGPGEGNGRVVRPGQILGITIGDDFSGKTYLEVR
jgi:hypothetical protein